ncbi:MAG: four helix bundle protein [Nitrospirota bacterium]
MVGKTIKSFEDLEVWRKGKELVLSVYDMAKNFPHGELYGLTMQVKRAALSVPANIAEGFGRYHYMDKAKFYLNARGSLYELKSHLLIAKEMRLGIDGEYKPALEMIERLSVQLNNLITATRKRGKRD